VGEIAEETVESGVAQLPVSVGRVLELDLASVVHSHPDGAITQAFSLGRDVLARWRFLG
jgi:hypothetical protein